MLRRLGQAAAISALGSPFYCAAPETPALRPRFGAIVGEPAGALVGEKVLAEGGNAVDAAVAAALTSCVVTPARCGIGGYGGHMIIALAGGKKITSLDFNTMAPAAARPDMYPLDAKGEVKGRVNVHGWLSAGVPGTLAGLQLALDRYGTRSFRELVRPAIAAAQKGFVIEPAFANSIRGAAARFRKDPGSAKLYLSNSQPRQAGEILRNPDLAKLLSTLADRNSVEPFYRGDLAQRIAEAYQKNGGLVTVNDLAAYHAREVAPLDFKWNDFAIFTAPLTAGGLTILEAFSILKALNWGAEPSAPASTHAQLETLRLAWKDRLELLGDPEKVAVPVARLLSADYARELAAKVEKSVKAKSPLSIHIRKHLDEGTNNICCADQKGNLVAVTLTQGGTFGAQVTVDGLGLTLGHGMSRFDPHPEHPNAPGPGKRPLHNMCPSIVLRDGKPVLAIGAAGGVKIPNSVLEVLANHLVRRLPLAEAVLAPRSQCAGTLDVAVEPGFPDSETDYLKRIGFKVYNGESARVSAVSFDPDSGDCRTAMR